MMESLLATKLHIPLPRRDLVPRPRLMERLDQGASCRLTLVSAPAGFGKTTLVSAWVHSAEVRGQPRITVAWLSLDEGDNDPTRFLSYLVAMLEASWPGVGQVAGTMLQSPQPPPVPAVLAALINDVVAVSATPQAASLTLVLDDYHVITAEPVHNAVTFLLDHLPPSLHVLLLTRADPPLPLARLRASRELAEIREADLRFTGDEVVRFIHQATGQVLSAEAVTLLERRTEGWIAGLQLAALSMQGREDVSGFVARLSGSHRHIVDYLTEEVLDRQPERVQDFLLRTSILDRLAGPLCEAVLPPAGAESNAGSPPGAPASAQAMLEHLERANLFVIPLDDERCWYRYHHLFADVLRSTLQQTSPDLVPDLHRSAAQWHESHGTMREAVRHALASGDQEYAARLVEQNALSLMVRGELATLLAWIEAIQQQQIAGRPWLAIYQAWVLSLTGHLNEVEHWLQEAEQSIPPEDVAPEARHMQGHLSAIRAHLATLRGDARQAVEFSHLALEELPESDQTVRSVATSTFAIACQLQGDLAVAARAFSEAARLGQAGGNLFLAIGATAAEADILVQQGRLRQAVETYRLALELATLPDGRQLPGAGRVYPGLAGILCEWNDLPAAARLAHQGIALLQQSGRVEPLAAGYGMVVRVRQAQGDLAGAEEALREVADWARTRELSPTAAASIDAARVRLWLAQGNLDACARWAQQTGLQAEAEVPLRRAPEAAVLVRVLLAQGSPGSALALAERLLRSAEAAGLEGFAIEVLVLQVLALLAQGQVSGALAVLEQALAAGQEEGYVRVFVDEGRPMEGLLRQARLRGRAADCARRLLAAFAAEAQEATATVPHVERAPEAELAGLVRSASPLLVEPLSPRELEVLRLVASGWSNREIADELVLAPGTVKKHVSNIFGKLGVHSRTQCLARARELHLIGE